MAGARGTQLLRLPICIATESVAGIASIATSAETAAGTNNTKAITPAKLTERLSSTAGYNKTYVDVTASRASGTTYTNSTGAPIEVFLSFDTFSGVETATVVVGGVTIFSGDMGVTGQRVPMSFLFQMVRHMW